VSEKGAGRNEAGVRGDQEGESTEE